MSKQEQHRRRILDGVIGACLLALLYLGYSFVPRLTRDPAGAHGTERPEVVGKPAPHQQVSPEITAKSEALVRDETTAGAAHVRPVPDKPLTGVVPYAKLPSQPVPAAPNTAGASPSLGPVPSVTESKPAAANDVAQPRFAFPVATAALPSGSGSNRTIPLRAARPAGRLPVVVPESTLNRQLDSPHLPAYASDPSYYDSSQRKYPHLLRRGTMPVFSPDSVEDSETVAALHTPDIPGIPANTKRTVSSGAMRGGVVRSACLGMMAGNLDYSPVPAYPSAAAAARVQGQVRIEATVDRDGSVTAARVVSGPPLLREAALDAVQQWRYKPYVAAGKAKPAGTTAVLDFALP